MQGFLEKKLLKITGENVRVCGAGRTDAGVHARNYRAHFSTNLFLDGTSFQRALNSGPRGDLWIRKVRRVSSDFHARFHAKGKRYLYCLVNTKEKPVFCRNFYWRVFYNLDIDAMKEAASYLVGYHDFSAFRSSSCSAKNPFRRVTYIGIHCRGNKIYIGVHGVSFLQYMVRNIVGTLVDVGRGRFSPEYVIDLIKNKDRNAAGKTAPAHGLFLMNVLY